MWTEYFLTAMFPRVFSHADDTQLLDRLARAAAQPEDATRQHGWRVATLARRLAWALGFKPHDGDLIVGAARYHDIGKIAVPADVLGKRGPLSEFERRLVQTHTVVGQQILEGGRSPLLRLAAQIAVTHHERWDGSGYPHRIRREAIPMVGRIVAVADAWDALTNPRPYRPACTEAEALMEIGSNAGGQFDPVVVDALSRVLAAAESGNEAAAIARASCPAAFTAGIDPDCP